MIARTKDRELNRQLRGVEPPRRYGHACVQYNGKVYMFGGRNDDDGSFKVMEWFVSCTSCSRIFIPREAQDFQFT